MPTPISTINAPNPTPTISPANAPGGKPLSPCVCVSFPDVPFGEVTGGGDAEVGKLVVGCSGEGGVLLGDKGEVVGDRDGGEADIAGDSLRQGFEKIEV